ncbi:MAG: 30S ribosomal protein S6, partial [Actinomycetota bacterium]|nr:30S ribosomal protein S6 [Actinomycetota bacterium]
VPLLLPSWGPPSPEEVDLRKYEILLILPPDADEQVVVRVTDRITQALSQRGGGQIDKIDRWGRRRLAYQIAHLTEGYYLLVEFTAEPAAIVELERVLTLADEVIRHKVGVRAA